MISTERLILRELLMSDLDDMYEMDSDPEVCKYLCVNPIQSKWQMQEKIEQIRKRQKEQGIYKWVVESKDTNNFIGWAGMQYIEDSTHFQTPYQELGIRLKKEYWGMGYATEAARTCIHLALNEIKIKTIFAIVDQRNLSSVQVLEKIGMKRISELIYHGAPHFRYALPSYLSQM